MNLSQQWGFIAAIVFNALLNPDLALAQEVYKAPGIQITTTEFDDTALIFAEPDSMNLGDGLGKEWQLNSVVTKKQAMLCIYCDSPRVTFRIPQQTGTKLPPAMRKRSRY